jgi:hypothetical protein
MKLIDIKMIRHLRARLRQVDRTVWSIDPEGPALRDSVVETLRTLRRELKEVGDIIAALQRLERSRSTEHSNVTSIKHKRRRTARRS